MGLPALACGLTKICHCSFYYKKPCALLQGASASFAGFLRRIFAGRGAGGSSARRAAGVGAGRGRRAAVSAAPDYSLSPWVGRSKRVQARPAAAAAMAI